ncbi:MAG: Ig-like domain-containing protein [Verrucomicrobia bacterium]|nr:Ig-like domain-containing protein [Verrucomicrobiota bacterium]
MKTNTPTPRTFRGLPAIALALAALGLSQPAAQAGIITTDDTVKLSASSGQNNASVVGQWTTAKGSAPVDTANDLLKNHATMSMASGGAGLGRTAYINDGLMLSNGQTSDSTDGLCLYTSSGSWTGNGPVDVVFTLDANYNIGRIDGFTLWDLSRLGQKYDLYGSTDSGASWNLVTSINQDATGSDGNRYLRRISLTDSDGVITGLAGVNALKFHIMDPGPGGTSNFNNNSIYAEIAAYALVLADAANSSVEALPTTVASDGVTTSTITVTLRDASSNPVAGKTVTLASNRADGVDTISAASGPSSGSGVVTFTVSSSTSGPAIFTATDVSDGNLVISPSTATVTFMSGAVSEANSTVTADPSAVTADGSASATITVTLKDASGTAVQGKTVELVSSRGTPPDTISPTSGVSNLSGVVTFAVSSATAGDATFTATDTDDSLPLSQKPTVTFTPGPVAAGTSTVTASPATAAADGIATSRITVTLLDANSNRVAGKDVFLASDRGTPPDTILPASGNTSDANGVATFTVSSAIVGSPVFTATGDSVPITETATVSFVYALPVTDTTVHTGATGESDSQVVAKWTADQGSAPVDTVNDLLKNHATVAMAAGNVAAGLGCSLANINDGLQVSKLTDSNTDGMCLFTNNGGWPSSGPADLVFALDASYDIARIDSFTLWDPSRTGQKYDLAAQAGHL